jgi:hypothetical protein
VADFKLFRSTPNPSTPTKGRVVFKLGPLSITAVTLQYKEQGMGSQKILSIVLDATFIMGPMSFSLLGFSLGVPLSGDITLNNLAHLASEIVVGIQGLALSFSSPPLLIAGGFEHQVVADGEIYLGGLGVGWPPYTFVGLGEYEVLNSYKSVFIYAKLDGRKYLSPLHGEYFHVGLRFLTYSSFSTRRIGIRHHQWSSIRFWLQLHGPISGTRANNNISIH